LIRNTDRLSFVIKKTYSNEWTDPFPVSQEQFIHITLNAWMIYIMGSSGNKFPELNEDNIYWFSNELYMLIDGNETYDRSKAFLINSYNAHRICEDELIILSRIAKFIEDLVITP